MSHLHSIPTKIQIAAPSGPAAFVLEQRLAHLAPVSVEIEGQWTVELEDANDSLDEIEAVVRHWLHSEQLDSAELSVNGSERTLEVAVPR